MSLRLLTSANNFVVRVNRIQVPKKGKCLSLVKGATRDVVRVRLSRNMGFGWVRVEM